MLQPGAVLNNKNGATGASRPNKSLSYEEQKAMDIEKYADEIYYSERYYDDHFEYRHVLLPTGLRKYLPQPMRLMSEDEWRRLGVRQSYGWEHYMVHAPEPHVLLFKREKNFQQKYGAVKAQN
ncbi:hypothetical protein EV182_005863, partial [Spiromyces aspiralis]